jgi:hypothetical protein
LLAVLHRHRSELVARQEDTTNHLLEHTTQAIHGSSSHNATSA